MTNQDIINQYYAKANGNPTMAWQLAAKDGVDLNKLIGNRNGGYGEQAPAPNTSASAPAQSMEPSMASYVSSFEQSDKDMSKQYEQSSSMANQYNSQYMTLLQRLMDREDKLGSGNPFVDMLDGYVRMKRQKNPNYQWEGLLPMAMGLFKKKQVAADGDYGNAAYGNNVTRMPGAYERYPNQTMSPQPRYENFR